MKSCGLLALFISGSFHGIIAALLFSGTGPESRRTGSDYPAMDVCFVEKESGGVSFRVSGKGASVTTGPKLNNSRQKMARVGVAPPPIETGTGGKETFPDTPASIGAESGDSGTGAGAITTFFQVPARGHSIVYLIDCSSSMGPSGALDAARRELLASLHRLPRDVRFQVIVYNSSARALVPQFQEWMCPDPPSLERVESALNELAAEGRTNYAQALQRGLALQPDVLFLLTDADSLPLRLVREVIQRNRRRTVIHVIELTTGHGVQTQKSLQQLARDNQGIYRAVNPEP
jgi:VWA domain-containing protein